MRLILFFRTIFFLTFLSFTNFVTAQYGGCNERPNLENSKCNSGLHYNSSIDRCIPISKKEVLKCGCKGVAYSEEIVELYSEDDRISDILAEKVSNASTSNMTTFKVTEETTVYRATNLKWDIEALKKGYLKSRYQHRLSKQKTDDDIKDFIDRNGPDLIKLKKEFRSEEDFDQLQRVYMLMAITSSSQPASQFTSVALNYEVAKGFAYGDWVFRFDVVPNSPILGLHDCSLESSNEGQFQIIGGTPIKNLARKNINDKLGEWEYYHADSDSWNYNIIHDELKK